MKALKLIGIVFCTLATMLFCTEVLLARGIGGGGGFGGGGGRSIGGGGGISRPNVSRPSAPSISRPSAPSMNRPAASRPSLPSSRPSTLPSGSGNRPNIGGGNRPNVQPGSRPSISPGSRPSITPGNRPNIGGGERPTTLPGTTPGSRPGIGSGNRPGIGENRPGIDTGRPLPSRPSQRPTLPGGADRPTTLPGLGGGERPGIGERPTLDDRRDSLQDRLNNSNGDRLDNIGDRMDDRVGNRGDQIDNRGDRVDNRGDRWDDRQGRWDQRQDHFDDWYDHHYGYHGGWHNGCWHGPYNPGDRWNYWWDNYPALTAFGVTTWAINRVGWAFGYYNYSNPYAASATYVDNSVYNYSQPIVTSSQSSTETTNADGSAPAEPPPAAMSAFDQARNEFYEGNYDAALKSTDAALKEYPQDAVVHEFRGLTFFALGKYQDAAATLYAVLAVGPGWDWTTMSGLYPSVSVYEKQLRSLEDYCKSKPDDFGARFVLAYHYLTQGHEDAAVNQLKKVVTLNPQDQVSRQLLESLDPDAEIPNEPKAIEPPQPETAIESERLNGDWSAKRGSEQFEMDLKADGSFQWTYTAGGKPQSVGGTWAVDKDGVLALEMSEDDVMLAQVVPKDNQLDFYMLGDTQGSEPLHFTK